MLHHLATTSGIGANAKSSKRLEHENDALRIVQMSLEVEGSGPLVERAIDRALETDIRGVRALLSSFPSESVAAASRAIEVARRSHDARLVEREPLDTDESRRGCFR